MATRSHPPAWYPDPGDPHRIRRWNGRAWTGDVRPLPDWLRTLRLSPGPGGRPPHATHRLWLLSVCCLLIGAALALGLGSAGSRSADRIGDQRFVALANARCAQTEADVVEPNRHPTKGAAEVQRIDALATGWEEMTRDLAELDVRPADQARVDGWLAAWGGLTSLTRDYAEALGDGDEEAARQILLRGEVPKRVVGRFAYVNGMGACIFRSQ